MDHFEIDNLFSVHKDKLLKPYFKQISYEGRFIITTSEMLQKQCGVDVILQGSKDCKEYKIDTKHVRGVYSRLFLEEKSNSIYNKDGWLLKDKGHPDYILYCMWGDCKKCYQDCNSCKKNNTDNLKSYLLVFTTLKQWFMSNYSNFPFFKMSQINKTTGRIVPINLLIDNNLCKEVFINQKMPKRTEKKQIFIFKTTTQRSLFLEESFAC